MCIGGGGSSYTPPPTPRWLQDTSKEVIKSKYELSDENKKRNKTRTQAKYQQRRSMEDSSNDHDYGKGTVIGGRASVNANQTSNKAIQDVIDSYDNYGQDGIGNYDYNDNDRSSA